MNLNPKDLVEVVKKEFRFLDVLIFLGGGFLYFQISNLDSEIGDLRVSIAKMETRLSRDFQEKLDRLDLRNRKFAYNLRARRPRNKFILYASPMKLTAKGKKLLRDNSLISLINEKRDFLEANLKDVPRSKYKIKEAILDAFFTMKYSNPHKIENVAYEAGVEPDDIKGYMAIYFRDQYFKKLKL